MKTLLGRRRAIGILATTAATLAVPLTFAACGSTQASGGPTSSAGAMTPAPKSDFGVLVMAHGGTPEWNAGVLDAVKPLRDRYDIEVAFGMADAASLAGSVEKLESRGAKKIAVVRLFVSGESFVAETEQILGLVPGAPSASAPSSAHPIMAAHADAGYGAPPGHDAHGGAHGGGAHAGGAHGGAHGGHSMAFFRVPTHAWFALSTQGLADAAGMGNVLGDRALALSKAPAKEDVLILAHGPGDDAENTRWLAKLDSRAGVVRSRARFRRVQVETLREDWPDKRTEAEQRIRAYVARAKAEGGQAIVIPFRVQGFGPYAGVLQGLDYVSDGNGLIPHAEVTRWIEGEIQALERGPFRAPTST